MDVEQFMAKRRTDQDEWAGRFSPAAQAAVAGDFDLAMELVQNHLEELWAEDTNLPLPDFLPFLEKAADSLSLVNEDSSVEATSMWLAVAALNFTSTSAAFAQGKDLEWRTMRDSNVREIHEKAEGQQIHAGEMFDVGGELLPYPGWPGARPDNYLNCRCVARPVSRNVEATLIAGGPMKHWFGVLAPEGKLSGDGRMFAAGSLRNRDLPLPLTWQKSTSQGHDNAVVVAKITHLQRVGSEIRAEGDFLDSDDADQAMSLVEEFGRYGVSVDADEAVVGESAIEGATEFSDARICAAALVHIPAFAEAYISLGETPADFFEEVEEADEDVAAGLEAREISTEERDDLAEEGKAMDDGSFPIANCEDLQNAIQAIGRAKDPEAAKAHITRRAGELDCGTELPDTWALDIEAKRGPGWVTNPEETRRLHAYWTKKGQPGYAKIAWGTPGDFNRCRTLVGKEISENSPEDMIYLDNICAEWHHDALGIWPGEHKGAAVTENMAPALSLVASGWDDIDSKYFDRPDFIKGGVNLQGDHTFGYIAEWGVCHITYAGVCVEAPPSASNYAFFSTGNIVCSDGKVVEVGSLTIDTGHAPHSMSARAAAAHYDNTGAVWAYVAVGEDERGIWFSGIVSPNATEAQIKEALASGRVSGDWRTIGGSLELVAALSVNVAGFPKVAAGIDASGQVSLTAAGISEPESADAVELIANRVVEKIESRVAAKKAKEERINKLRSRLKKEDD